MPQAGRRGRPAGSRGRPGALAGEAGVSRGELRRQPPARGEAAAPAGLAQGDAAKPQRRSRGGREGGVGRDTFRARANCPRETLPGKRSSIRIGNARPGQQRDSPFSRRAPRKRLLRAHPTVAATRLWKRGGGWGGGQPKASCRLGGFHPPPLLACPGRWGFRVPFKTNPKAFTRCGKRVAGGKQSKSEPASKLCPFSQPPELDAPCASHRPSHAEGGLCRPAGKCLSVRCHELGSVSSKKEGARGFFPHPHPFH